MSDTALICAPDMKLWAEGYLAGQNDNDTKVVVRNDCPPGRVYFMSEKAFEKVKP